MTTSIEQVVGTIPSWSGRHVEMSAVGGGLTNTNFRVEVDGRPMSIQDVLRDPALAPLLSGEGPIASPRVP